MSDCSKSLLSIVLGLLGGCVYPADDPTGLEVSWRFFEGNVADGEEGRRVRTCAGMQVDTIAVGVEDRDDPQRRGSFAFDCPDGYQTQTDFQTRASDVFIPLRPGDYGVSLTARGAGRREELAAREVDVLGRGLTVELFELTPELVTWELSLAGLDACDEVAVALRYADPDAALAHPPRDEDGEVEPTLYRETLTTDRELGLFGEGAPCSDELAGDHVVELMDRGVYRLETSVDGRSCAFEVSIDEGARTSLDLDNLPCDG